MFLLKEPTWVIRKIAPVDQNRNVYLTFDDGPDAETTADVLDLLEKHNCKATFFVIGTKAKNSSEMIKRMIKGGHSVLSHSNDHDYFHYFQSSEKLQVWMDTSVNELNEITAQPVVGFRPPAGILNPPLIEASRALRMPLILWNHRFFDTAFALTRKKVDKALPRIKAGDIILLHDRQKPKNKKIFLDSLDHLISNLLKLSFQLTGLSQNEIKSAAHF